MHIHALPALAAILVSAGAASAQAQECALTQGDDVPANNFLFGGGKDVMSFADFTDLRDYGSDRDAVNWYLHSGVTNGGKDWDLFGPGDPIPKWELVHNLYRFYSIMNETSGPFTDVPILFGRPGADTSTERKFFVAMIALRGAGIIEAVDDEGNYRPDDPLTRQEFLRIVFESINSPDSSKVADTALPPGDRADLSGYEDAAEVAGDAVPAIAGMLNSGCYSIAGNRIDPTATVPRIEMVRLLYALRHTPLPRTLPDYAEARLSAQREAAGIPKRIYHQSFSEDRVNESLLYASKGAMVEAVSVELESSGGMKGHDHLAYRWGLGGAVIANDYGTQIQIRDAKVHVTGNEAYAFYATAGGSIVVRDSFIDGGRAAMVTYNGRVEFDNVTIRGDDRTYSSDHFGGTVIYRNVDSVKEISARGGGGFFLDENTTGEFYDSHLEGEGFLAAITGIGSALFDNVTASLGTGITLTNNTSLLSDIATVTIKGGDFRFTKGDFFNVQKAQRGIIRIDGARVTIPQDANLITLTHGSAIRLYLKNTDIIGNIKVEDGSNLDVYMENARVRGQVTGKVGVFADEDSHFQASE